MENHFKAGDFTSGKMNEIFKNSFSGSPVTITHKQLGTFILVDENSIRMDVIRILEKSGVKIERTVKSPLDLKHEVEHYASCNSKTKQNIDDYFFKDWISLLRNINNLKN